MVVGLVIAGHVHHPWRLPKRVTYWFNWLTTQLSRILHP
jgi:hypothetical protein